MARGTVRPRPQQATDDILKTGLGYVSWNFHPNSQATSNTAPATQTIYAVAVPYRAGQVVTNLCWVVQTAGAGTTPTNTYCGLSNSTTVLAQSADVKVSAQWTVAGQAVIPLSAAYTIPTSGIYYHLILQNGTWGTTQMLLSRMAGTVFANGSVGIFGTGGTGQTALPANNAAITITAAGGGFSWIAAST